MSQVVCLRWLKYWINCSVWYKLILMSLSSYEIGTIGASLGVLLSYHVVFYSWVIASISSSYDKYNTSLSANIKNSEIWLQKHKYKGDAASVTAAIQTFRNTILVATFVGGYSFNFAVSITNEYKNQTDKLSEVRSIILCTFLFLSFLCWASVIRFSSHLGYLIGSLSFTREEEISRKSVEIELTTSDSHPSVSESPNSAVLSEKMTDSALLKIRILFICFRLVCNCLQL